MNITENITEPQESDLISISDVCYSESFKIKIIFNDGTERIVDFEPFLINSQHPQIKKYLNIEKFKNFLLVDGNLNWNDYDLIFPLEDLYKGKI